MRSISKRMSFFMLLALISLLSARLHRNQSVAIIKGLWNIGRSQRNFRSYYGKFYEQLLESNENFVIYGSVQQTKDLVFNIRNQKNTIFVPKTLSNIKSSWYHKLLQQKISIMKRSDPLYFILHYFPKMPQFSNQLYLSLMITKFYMLKDTSKIQRKKPNSEYLMWVDAGSTHIYGKNGVINSENKRSSYSAILKIAAPDFFFVSTPYAGNQDWHLDFTKYLDAIQDQRATGTFFGGRTQVMSERVNVFQNFLRVTVQNFDISTEEALMRIMCQRYPYLFPNKPDISLDALHKVQFWNIHQKKIRPLRYHQYKLQSLATESQGGVRGQFQRFTQQQIQNQDNYQFYTVNKNTLALTLMLNMFVFLLLLELKKQVDKQITVFEEMNHQQDYNQVTELCQFSENDIL